MIELRLNRDEEKLDFIYIRCINRKRETGVYLRNTTFDEIITKFLLNEILHHVSMSWIVKYNKEMKYETDENNH